jgi:hypothetical protein
MENPCVTFVTPTLLAGDKSQGWERASRDSDGRSYFVKVCLSALTKLTCFSGFYQFPVRSGNSRLGISLCNFCGFQNAKKNITQLIF